MPLIDIKKKGFNIIGYDKAKNMVSEAKENLKKNRLSPDLVFYDDFENPKKVKNNSVDCILGMGAFYYAKNVNKTLFLFNFSPISFGPIISNSLLSLRHKS